MQADNNKRENNLTVAGYCTLHRVPIESISLVEAGKMAMEICHKRNLAISEVTDPKFGIDYAYPIEVLDEVFNRIIYNCCESTSL